MNSERLERWLRGCFGFTMPMLIEQGGQKRKGRTIVEGDVAATGCKCDGRRA